VTHCEVQLIPSPPVSQVSSDPAEDAYRLLLSTLGIAESSRHELDKTPARAAKAFREMTAGLRVEDPLWLGSWLRRYPLVPLVIKHGNGEDSIF
jgi:GTP cyclohydrolase I